MASGETWLDVWQRAERRMLAAAHTLKMTRSATEWIGDRQLKAWACAWCSTMLRGLEREDLAPAIAALDERARIYGIDE